MVSKLVLLSGLMLLAAPAFAVSPTMPLPENAHGIVAYPNGDKPKPVMQHTPTAHSPARHGQPQKKRVKKPMSEKQKANAARMHQCGQQWKADKAAGKTG